MRWDCSTHHEQSCIRKILPLQHLLLLCYFFYEISWAMRALELKDKFLKTYSYSNLKYKLTKCAIITSWFGLPLLQFTTLLKKSLQMAGLLTLNHSERRTSEFSPLHFSIKWSQAASKWAWYGDNFTLWLYVYAHMNTFFKLKTNKPGEESCHLDVCFGACPTLTTSLQETFGCSFLQLSNHVITA